MTIEELEEALSKIPPTGAINKATRRAILQKIYELMAQQEQAE